MVVAERKFQDRNEANPLRLASPGASVRIVQPNVAPARPTSMSAVRVVLVLAAAGALAAGVLLTLPPDGADRLRTQQPAEPSQVVRDGTRVTGTGSVVAVPGRAVRFCAPVPRADVGYAPGQEPAPEYCELGVDAEGVDLTALTNRREKDGAVEGQATLTGTYRDGTLVVEQQGQAPPTRPGDGKRAAPPCEAPEGGWPRDLALPHGPGHEPEGDANMHAEQPAMDRYRAKHPDDIVTIALLRPFPDSVIMGVSAVDQTAAARAEQALRPTYGKRLCVVVSRFSRAQVAAAQEELQIGSDEARRLGVMGGAGEGVSDDLQVEVGYDVVMVTEELQRRAEKHPPGLLVLRPWLAPA